MTGVLFAVVFVDTVVMGDTFRVRDAALTVLIGAALVSETRRGRPFGSAGAGVLGDLEVPVLRIEVVDVVETFLDRVTESRGVIFSRGVLNVDSRVEAPLLLLDIDTFESEDVGREDG